MILDAAPPRFCEKEQYAPYLLHFEAVEAVCLANSRLVVLLEELLTA